MTHGGARTTRIRCPACGTEQEGAGAACLICGRPLRRDDADPGLVSPPDPSPAGRATVALPERAPETRSEEIDELVALERRTTALLALVPVWGAWRAWRSESHGPFERAVLGVLSVVVTGALALALFEAIPGERDRAAAALGRAEAELVELEELLRRYRGEYGKWPDAETWDESVRRGDRRFRDPWQRPYVLSHRDDGAVVVETLGRDGERGGEGEDQDRARTIGEKSR